MQMKSGNLLKATGIAAGVALLAGVIFAALADQYRSEAVLRAKKTQLNAEATTILGRANLTRLILRENLYDKDRARVPLEELALRLRSSVLIWSERKDGPTRIRVYIPDDAVKRSALLRTLPTLLSMRRPRHWSIRRIFRLSAIVRRSWPTCSSGW